MRHKNKGKKAKAASNNAIIASVVKEMAKPRIAESASHVADEQSEKRRGAPTRHQARGTAKTHIERYGTGTPTVETQK
jgi:hypothetical protein